MKREQRKQIGLMLLWQVLLMVAVSVLDGGIGAMMAVVSPGDSNGDGAGDGTGVGGQGIVAGDTAAQREGGPVGKHVHGEAHDTEVDRDYAKGLIHDPIDREIVKMYQSAIPIDQITRMSPAQQVKGMRYWYYSADTRPIRGKIMAATLAQQTNAAVTVTVDQTNILDWTDVIMFPTMRAWNPSTSDYTSDVPLHAYVVRGDGTGIALVCINGQPIDGEGEGSATQFPAIAAETEFIRLGHAASEGDVQTAPYTALPTKREQFMQIFKSQTLESTISMDSEREVNWTPTDTDELNIHNMRKEIELTYLFGVKGYFRNDTTRRMVYTTDGIIPQILKNGRTWTHARNTVDEDALIDLTQYIFTGNNGSSDRLLLAGSGFVAALAKIPSIQKTLDANSVERVLGYSWHKIVTNFGTLHMMMHPLFDQVGDNFTNKAIVIDKQYLSKRVFRSMTRTQLDLITTGVYDGKSTVLTEISSVILKYGQCHALLELTV